MQQLRAARAVKKRKAEERKSLYFIPESTLQRVDVGLEAECGLRPEALPGKQPSVCAHWEDIPLQNGLDSEGEDEGSDWEEDIEVTDGEEEDLPSDGTAFDALLSGSQCKGVFEKAAFYYQRGPTLSIRSQQLKRKADKALAQSVKGSKKIFEFPGFQSSTGPAPTAISEPTLTPAERTKKQCEAHIKTLERKLSDKRQRAVMNGQTLLRHEAVLQFLRIQLNRQKAETRESLSQIIARCFNRGGYFAQRIIRWEIEWTQTGAISESRRGCFMKTCSWFNEGFNSLYMSGYRSTAATRPTR